MDWSLDKIDVKVYQDKERNDGSLKTQTWKQTIKLLRDLRLGERDV